MWCAIRAVAKVWEEVEIVFCLVNNARFRRFPVDNISRNLNTTTSIGKALKTFGTKFWQFYRKGSFLPKKRKNSSTNFQVLKLQAAITPQWLQMAQKLTTKIALYEMSSFHFLINSISFHWDLRRVQERYLTKFSAKSDVRYCVNQYAAGGSIWKKIRPELKTKNK